MFPRSKSTPPRAAATVQSPAAAPALVATFAAGETSVTPDAAPVDPATPAGEVSPLEIQAQINLERITAFLEWVRQVETEGVERVYPMPQELQTAPVYGDETAPSPVAPADAPVVVDALTEDNSVADADPDSEQPE